MGLVDDIFAASQRLTMHGLDGWMRLGTLPIPTKPMSLVSVQPPPLNRLASSRKTVCTQTIVDTMPKDSETPRSAAQRTPRTYTRQFKAQLVAACHQPGVSIAALALHHGVNTNVLHRWLKEHARSGCHQITVVDALGAVATSEPNPQCLPGRDSYGAAAAAFLAFLQFAPLRLAGAALGQSVDKLRAAGAPVSGASGPRCAPPPRSAAGALPAAGIRGAT